MCMVVTVTMDLRCERIGGIRGLDVKPQERESYLLINTVWWYTICPANYENTVGNRYRFLYSTGTIISILLQLPTIPQYCSVHELENGVAEDCWILYLFKIV